jgi:hypothetical protein
LSGRGPPEQCGNRNTRRRWRAATGPVSDGVAIIHIPQKVIARYRSVRQGHEKPEDRRPTRRRALVLVHPRDAAVTRVPRGIDELSPVH